MAKAAAPPPAAPKVLPQGPKILQSPDFTALVSPEGRTLARQRPDAASIVCRLQQALRHGFGTAQSLIQLLSGGWRS